MWWSSLAAPAPCTLNPAPCTLNPQPSPLEQGLLIGDVFFREYVVEFDMVEQTRPIIGIAKLNKAYTPVAVTLTPDPEPCPLNPWPLTLTPDPDP